MRKKKHGNRASSYIRREGAADVIDMEPVHSLTSVHRTSHHRSSHHRMGPFKELLQVNNYKEGQGAYWCHFCKIIMAGLSISMTSASKAEFQLYHLKPPGQRAWFQALPEHRRAARLGKWDGRGRLEPEVISSTRNVSPELSLCFLERLSEFFAVQSRELQKRHAVATEEARQAFHPRTSPYLSRYPALGARLGHIWPAARPSRPLG